MKIKIFPSLWAILVIAFFSYQISFSLGRLDLQRFTGQCLGSSHRFFREDKIISRSQVSRNIDEQKENDVLVVSVNPPEEIVLGEELELTVVPSPVPTEIPFSPQEKFLKDVGEPYLDHFGLKDSDFKLIRQSGFTVIESNFDICAFDEDISFFLNKAQEYGLKVVLNAGSGEAEWGYECETQPLLDQYPVWQENLVRDWVRKWKDHPAIYAWDISNEAGGNFPWGEDVNFRLSLHQMQQAYQTVKEADSIHPVMIRMNGWYFYDDDHDFFRKGNPFGQGVADIVMVNSYSNVEEYFPDFVGTVIGRSYQAIGKIDPGVKIICALGVWEEEPLWFLPTISELENDWLQTEKFPDLLGIAFFKYGASLGGDWFLPDEERGSPLLWERIKELQ